MFQHYPKSSEEIEAVCKISPADAFFLFGVCQTQDKMIGLLHLNVMIDQIRQGAELDGIVIVNGVFIQVRSALLLDLTEPPLWSRHSGN